MRASSLADRDARMLRAPSGPARVKERGRALIAQPLLNKGTGFTAAERAALDLRGLLPARVTTIEEQVALELEHIRRKADDLERYIGLAALQDRNETLFYRVLLENLEEFLPIVYTPTVGRACQEYSHILRRPRGVWITPDDIDDVGTILRTAADGDVRLIVVTDNERILGLGDQGAGGIAIPVGKLTLYTAGAGIYPAWTLPVSLDVGTDRRELLEDPLYLGYRAPRLRGPAYDQVVEAFVQAVRTTFPGAIVQWEDFKQHTALALLDRYRATIPSFNDDIQGTAAVVVAGLMAARNGTGLANDRFLIVGAGAAGIGIARLIERVLQGSDRVAAGGAPVIALLDRQGLVQTGRPVVPADQRPFAVDAAWVAAAGLDEATLRDPVAVARALGVTVLIGVTGSAGAFSEGLVRAVARNAREPIVLPLSNPADQAEASAADVLAWTDGRALVATGGPSAAVSVGGATRSIGQANNVFIFPGVGLGAMVAEAVAIPDETFLVAAAALASCVSKERRSSGALYPSVADLRRVAHTVAVAVVRFLRDAGLGRAFDDHAVAAAVDRAMWQPGYVPMSALGATPRDLRPPTCRPLADVRRLAGRDAAIGAGGGSR